MAQQTFIIIVDTGTERQLLVQDMSDDPFETWQQKVSAQLRNQGFYTAKVQTPAGDERKTDVVVKGSALVMYMSTPDMERLQQRAKLVNLAGGMARS